MAEPHAQAATLIPGYEILSELGRGGVSTVYLARHEILEREVAIKVMSPALTVEEGFSRRFIREGKTVARLEHPGIVRVYDVSVSNYRPYIAMEYLPGGSLKDRIKRPMPPGEAIAVLQSITDSLGYAHATGIFHRDVKPENILFRRNGDPVLTDFGIAKSDSHDTALTSVGVVVGTPRYISPEQAQGHGCDERSDIYALGVILHEMLTARPPYDVKGSMSLLYAHINDPIPRLPGALKAYQSLLDDLLAKDPDQRIPDCETLAERLNELAGDNRPAIVEKTRESRVPPLRRRRRYRRTKPRTWVLAAVATALFGYLIWSREGLWMPGTATGEENIDLRAAVTRLMEEGEPQVPKQDGIPSTGGKNVPPVEREAGLPVDKEYRRPPWETETLPIQSNVELEGGDRAVVRREALPAGGEIPPPEEKATHARSGGAEKPTTDKETAKLEGVAKVDERRWRTLPRDEAELDDLYRRAQSLYYGVTGRRDRAAAVDLYREAASYGHAASQFRLGVAYGNGEGVARDEQQAVQWLARAARAGIRDARYNLILAKLFGPRPDPAEAARVARQLANESYAPVYRILGWMYNTGFGVDSSFTQSVRWNFKTMVGDWTGNAVAPNAVVAHWERRLNAELDKIWGPGPPEVK